MSVRLSIVFAAIALGVLGDVLLDAPGAPGLNLVLWCAAGALAIGLLVLRRGRPATPESTALVALALLFISGFAVRDADALRALNMLTAAVAVSLACAESGAAWIRLAGAGSYVRAGVTTGLALIAGPLPLIGGPDRAAAPVPASGWLRESGLGAVRGTLLAVPPLLVFGALLTSADPVFARVISSVFRIEAVLEHLVLVAFIAWGTAGYLNTFVLRSPFAAVELPLRQPRIGVIDGTVALSLLSTLFIVFIAVQLRYLFGGTGMVEVTPGLSYAEYARRGFFELVAVSALVIPLLLLADWAVLRERMRDEYIFRIMAVMLVVLLFGIIGSAVYRMRLYQQAYGLTELRLYTTVFMGWIAVVLAWLVATVLRGRRRHFAFGALVAAFVAGAGLNIANPHALIVRVNAARAAAGHPYDATYTANLSADAVPALLEVLPRLSGDDRCRAASHLVEKWGQPRSGGWRTWNYSDARARQDVVRAANRLQIDACPLQKEETGTSNVPVPS